MKHAIRHTIRQVLTITAAVCAAILSACHHHHEPVPPEPQTPENNHTLLVYMVASNNLQGYDNADIAEMKLLFSTPGIDIGNTRILIYQKTYTASTLSEVTADGIIALKEYDNTQLSVSVDRMREVFGDMKEHAPAEEYGLVLWSHATGWLQNGVDDEKDTYIPMLRSYGSDNGNYMNITALSSALENAGFRYIYFDCCYMGGIEVAYQLRKHAEYLIFSPAEDPTYGMRYDLTVPCLVDNSLAVAERMTQGANATFEYYNSTFAKGDCPCTLTVLRTDMVDKLAQRTREIYQKADRPVDPDYSYQRFKVSGACPYYDFDEYVESICDDQHMLAQWRTALCEAVLYEAHTPYIWSTPLNRCCGLSTYILSSQLSATNNNYNTLAWYNDIASALFE